jgi:hypothetical protein
MPIRFNYLNDPISRGKVWKILNEDWGYFNGSIQLSDMQTTRRFQESQLAFHSAGHNHDGVNSRLIRGVQKPHFDLNQTDVVWLDYFATPPDIYILMGGHAEITFPGSGVHAFTALICAIDYNLNTTAPVSTSWDNPFTVTLNIRKLSKGFSAFDGTRFNGYTFNFVAAWATPVYDAAGFCATALNISVVNPAGPTNVPAFLATIVTPDPNPKLDIAYWVLVRLS